MAFASALVLALALSVGGCAVSEKDKAEMEREEIGREVKEEVEVGRQMAAKLMGHFGLDSEHPEATRYVSMIGQTVAEQSGRPEITYRFAILKSDEINAFATPGGFIFLTRGLLKQVRSESELAGVLGHEVAHVSEKHLYDQIKPKRDVSAGETVTRFLSRGGADIGAAISKVVGQGLKILLEEGLGQEKEHAADKAGVMFAGAVGYDSKSLATLLKRIHENEKSVKVSKTHPPFPARLQSLEKFLAENGLKAKGKGDSKVMDKRFKAALVSYLSPGGK